MESDSRAVWTPRLLFFRGWNRLFKVVRDARVVMAFNMTYLSHAFRLPENSRSVFSKTGFAPLTGSL